MTKNKKQRYWKICIAAVMAITIIGYTPVMIPAGKYNPEIFGIPYSLWLSFLLTLALVVLTYIGAKVHPGTDKEEEQK